MKLKVKKQEQNNKNINKLSIKEKIFTIIFIIWFCASIAGLILSTSISGYLTIIIFGQYFLVFGLIALFNNEMIGSVFAIIGLLAILIPIFMMNPELIPVTINWDIVIPILMLSIFVFAGIGIIFGPLLNKKREKKEASVCVTATVYDVLFDSPDARNINYNIVYQYTYNGKDYLEETEYYQKENIPNIGDIHDIYICPNDPSFIYNSKIKGFPLLIIMGILFILSGLFAIYAFLFL